MNIATVHHNRSMLPMLNLLVAGAAVTLGVVAITTDDAGSITPPPASAVTTRAGEAAAPRAASSSVTDHAGDCRFAVPGVATRC